MGSIDIWIISETKLAESFPIGQFFGVPYRVDGNGNGGGITLFVREDIPSKKKWLFSCSFNPDRENVENHLETLSKNLALSSSSYENLVIIGDFNVCMEEISMSGFCDTFGLKSLIKDATYYKIPENAIRLTSF